MPKDKKLIEKIENEIFNFEMLQSSLSTLIDTSLGATLIDAGITSEEQLEDHEETLGIKRKQIEVLTSSIAMTQRLLNIDDPMLTSVLAGILISELADATKQFNALLVEELKKED